MPFLDGFAEGFNNSFSTSGWQTREERERMAAQTAIQERQIQLEEEYQPYKIAESEATTARTQAETEALDFKNSEVYQNAFIDNLYAETAGITAKAGLDQAQSARINHELTDAQVALANAKTESEITHANALAEQAVANAEKLGLDADLAREALKPENLKRAQDKADADTRKVNADAYKTEIEASSMAGDVLHEIPGHQAFFQQMFPHRDVSIAATIWAGKHENRLPPSDWTEAEIEADLRKGDKTQTQAIPEAEAPPAAASPDEEPIDEPAPGEGPDETYQSAPPVVSTAGATAAGQPAPPPVVPPPAGAPAAAPAGGAIPTAAAPAVTGAPPASPATTGSIAQRSLADYQAMTRQELAALPPAEYNRYVELYEAASAAGRAPAPTPAAAIPPAAGAAAAPAAGPAVPERTGFQAWLHRPGVPQGRAEYSGQQQGYPGIRPSPRAAAPAAAPAAAGQTAVPPAAAVAPTPAAGALPEARVPQVRPAPAATGAIPTGGGPTARGNVIEQQMEQASTRKLPLNAATRQMLDAASGATGYTVRVTSGAQPSEGPDRTGSHRHDVDVGAADLQLIDNATGKPVNMTTPEGQKAILKFMRAARDAGATGFGAGVDYMGADTIHVGFGEAGVWGAGGKRGNAPKWLVDGMNMGAGPSTMSGRTPSRPAGVAQAYQLLQGKMPQMQAAVLAGNIQQESNGDPNALNKGEGAHGLIQWRDSRWTALQKFASDAGKNPNDMQTQIDFLMHEGTTVGSAQDKKAWAEFMAAKTPEEANAALKKYIRYGDESADKRLEYANNILKGGGQEIKGEKLAPQSKARQAMKIRLVEGGKEVAKIGAKAAAAEAGITGGPEGAVPVADPAKEQRMRDYVTGNGAGSPRAIYAMREKVLKHWPEGETVKTNELNLMVAQAAYNVALKKPGGAKEAEKVAMGIQQTYKMMASQRASFAKMLVQNGRLNEAAQMMLEVDAYVLDGQTAEFTYDQQNRQFYVKKTDDITGDTTEERVLSVEEFVAGVLGWNPTDIDKQLMRAAGQNVQSRARELADEQLQEPAEPLRPPPGSYERQAVPMLKPIDTSQLGPDEQFTEAERDDYRLELEAANKTREAANAAAALKDLTPEQRTKVNEELERVKQAERDYKTVLATGEENVSPDSMGENAAILGKVYGNNLNSILAQVLRSNPNEVAETIVGDLRHAIDRDTQRFSNGLPFEYEVGDKIGTWKVHFADSPTEYNIPHDTMIAIHDGIMGSHTAKTGEMINTLTDVGGAMQRSRENIEAQAAKDKFAAEAAQGIGTFTPLRPQQQRPPLPKASALPVPSRPSMAGPVVPEIRAQFGTPTARGPTQALPPGNAFGSGEGIADAWRYFWGNSGRPQNGAR